jgi:hypothetical protein
MSSNQCIATTATGAQCTRRAVIDNLCTQHYNILNKHNSIFDEIKSKKQIQNNLPLDILETNLITASYLTLDESLELYKDDIKLQELIINRTFKNLIKHTDLELLLNIINAGKISEADIIKIRIIALNNDLPILFEFLKYFDIDFYYKGNNIKIIAKQVYNLNYVRNYVNNLYNHKNIKRSENYFKLIKSKKYFELISSKTFYDPSKDVFDDILYLPETIYFFAIYNDKLNILEYLKNWGFNKLYVDDFMYIIDSGNLKVLKYLYNNYTHAFDTFEDKIEYYYLTSVYVGTYTRFDMNVFSFLNIIFDHIIKQRLSLEFVKYLDSIGFSLTSVNDYINNNHYKFLNTFINNYNHSDYMKMIFVEYLRQLQEHNNIDNYLIYYKSIIEKLQTAGLNDLIDYVKSNYK